MPDSAVVRWSRFLLDPTEPVHFVGIGGVGMAGLARLLSQRGFPVTGSDAQESRITRELTEAGVAVSIGHRRHHLPRAATWVVRTPAVLADNPELQAARDRCLPVCPRGELLAALSTTRPTVTVAGAHGKTTTSAMLAWVLRACGLDCGYAIGGETQLPGRVADWGTDPVFVCEADESDGTLVEYRSHIGLLPSVEWDHVEQFRTEASLLACYRRYASRCDQIWIVAGDPLAEQAVTGHPRVRRVSLLPGADLSLLERMEDPEGQTLHMAEGTGRLTLTGRHHATNALLALAAAEALGIPLADGLAALAGFRPVGRRFERTQVQGVTLIADYAHHPTEIRALMESVRALRPARILAAFQPHRFSRTRHLLAEFAIAFDGVASLHLLPVYAASESRGQGVESTALLEKSNSLRPTVLHEDMTSLANAAARELRTGDVFLIVGAGDIIKVVPMIHHAYQNRMTADA